MRRVLALLILVVCSALSSAQAQRAPQNARQALIDMFFCKPSMRAILAAEATYSSTYRNVGYTCSLSDLDGFGQGTPNEHQAMLIESRLASGKKHGYVFTLSACGTPPNTHFTLTAVPAAQASGRAFCGNESGGLRSSEDGQAASCLDRGTPLQ